MAFQPVTMRHARNSSVSVDIANRVLAAPVEAPESAVMIDVRFC
jgi:hypothetical protein